jgi:lipopolysaccharide export system permease protein
MAIGWTLAIYFARRFAVMVLSIFLFFALLVGAITYLEFMTRSMSANAFDPVQVLILTAFKLPGISEELLPFVTLFGSIAAFVVANRRLEVVIARAAGLSAWQFLLPACIVGLLFGVFGTTIYNPVATTLRGWADEAQARLFSNTPQIASDNGPIWLRQAFEGRESILGATQSFDHGLGLTNVTAFTFNKDGSFRERIDARSGHYSAGEWLLDNATVTTPGHAPKLQSRYSLPTSLSPNQVRQTFDNVDTNSFWELPALIAAAKAAGVSADRYQLRFHNLLSRPLVLLAMVLIAAIVSLRFSRSRDVGNMILAGVAVGFMLYVVSKIAWDLGSGGIVPPQLAAWLPAIVTLLVGTTVLLHLEDG